MPRKDTTDNRFNNAGKKLVKSTNVIREEVTTDIPELDEVPNMDESTTDISKPDTYPKKDKVITAKVYPDTWATFTAINRSQGMTNNSVINMLISNYVREKKELLTD